MELNADWSLDIHVSTWLVVVRIRRIGYWYNARRVVIGQIASVHLLTILSSSESAGGISLFGDIHVAGGLSRSSMLWSIALRLYFRNRFISAFSGNRLSLWSPKVSLATLKDRSLATDDGGGHQYFLTCLNAGIGQLYLASSPMAPLRDSPLSPSSTC